MSETSTPTSKYVQPGQPTVTTSPVASETTPVKTPQGNIDITGAKPELATGTKPSGKLDIAITNANPNYISTFVSPMSKGRQFNTNQNGDEYNLGGILTAKQDAISSSFKSQIMRDMKLQTNFNSAKESFSQLDNQNYRYIHNSIIGDMRVPIDENGRDIGLAEPLVS